MSQLNEACKHVKISHYEAGIVEDDECVEALNKINEEFPESVPYIKYIHNHKGSILVFWDEDSFATTIDWTSPNPLDKMKNIEKYVNIIEWVNYNDPSYATEMVENSVRFIRNKCEWIFEYDDEPDLMDMYFESLKKWS